MNGDETNMYTDLDEKKLQIVEEDVELGKNYLGKLNSTNNNSEHSNKKSNLKIGGKFVLKFRALMEFDYVQFFIQEADFAFYQYIVDFLIPKVCILLNLPSNIEAAIAYIYYSYLGSNY